MIAEPRGGIRVGGEVGRQTAGIHSYTTALVMDDDSRPFSMVSLLCRFV